MFVLFKTGSSTGRPQSDYVDKDDLKLLILCILSLNSNSTGTCHHAWLYHAKAQTQGFVHARPALAKGATTPALTVVFLRQGSPWLVWNSNVVKAVLKFTVPRPLLRKC